MTDSYDDIFRVQLSVMRPVPRVRPMTDSKRVTREGLAAALRVFPSPMHDAAGHQRWRERTAAIIFDALPAEPPASADVKAAWEACSFGPTHEPWSCLTHPAGFRTALDEAECSIVLGEGTIKSIGAEIRAYGDWRADQREAAVRAESAATLDAVDGCIAIVQQSLDTVRAEDDGESRSIRASIAAREHVIEMLTGYRARLAEADR